MTIPSFYTNHTKTPPRQTVVWSHPVSLLREHVARRVTTLEEQTQSMEAHDVVHHNVLDASRQNLHVIDRWVRQDSQHTDVGPLLDCSGGSGTLSMWRAHTLRRHDLYHYADTI